MIQHSENFFPAECGELLALLVKYYKDNPAVKGDKELKGVTAQNIYTFYKEMMEDIDKLPEEIKNMVYVLPSHFTTNRISIWIKRLVPIMTQFILSYVDEQGEDIGALLQRLCVDIDKANYNLFWNYKFISIARQANEEEAKKFERWMDFEYGDRDDIKTELERRINEMNASIDVAIAELIKRLMLDVSKERILDDQNIYDNKIDRKEYYNYLNAYTNSGDVNIKKETLNRYTNGAKTWKIIEEKIIEDNYMPEDVHLTYESELQARKEYISELKKKLDFAEKDLERFKNCGDDYIKKYNQVLNLIHSDLVFDYDSFKHMSEPNPFINEAAKLIGDIESLHTFAHIINRTRRRDIGNFTLRKPETLKVSCIPEQQERFDRKDGDLYNELYFDDSPY